MKSTFLVCLSILLSPFSFSQIEIFNTSLKEPALKLLYAGHPNTIVLSSELASNQTLSSTSSQITQIDSVTFILKPLYSTGMDTIVITTENVIVQSDYFRILNMPVVSVQIGSITPIQKFVSIKTVLSEPFLKIIPNGLYIHEHTVTSFQLSIYDVNDKLIHTFDETKGKRFTSKQIEQIKRMKKGDQLEISNINVEDFIGVSRTLRGYRVSIK